mgnify:CR=1 FL=1
MKKIISTFLTTIISTVAFAQMDNVVEVETTFTPTVQNAKKIDVLPQAETTSIPHYNVEYSLAPTPSGQFVFQPTEATMSDVATKGAPKGFLTLAGGNNCNILTRGAYGMNLSTKSSIDFDFGLRGHIGDADIYKAEDKTWRQRFYTSRALVKFQHRLSSESSLIIRADGESQVYNNQHKKGSNDFDKQHNWIGALELKVTPYTTGILSVGGYVRGKMFTRRNLLSPTTWETGDDRYDLTENKWELGLTTDLAINENIKAGVDLDYQTAGWNKGDYSSIYAFDIVPHLTIDNEKTYLRLGARLTFENSTELEYTLAENKTKKKFKVAPDVYASLHISPKVDIFGEATGGMVMNDFFQMQSLTPYWQLPYVQLPSAYNNICAKVGFKWNVLGGLFAKIYAGYDDTKNRAELTLPEGRLYQNRVMTIDGSLIHVNLEATYLYKDIINVAFKGRFNGWSINENNGYFKDNAVWRPTVEASANATFQPFSGLRFGVDYQFASFADDSALPYKRPTTSDLGASVSYKLPFDNLRNNFTIYCKLDNLLNQKYDWYYGQKTIGTSILAGFAIDF